MSILSFACAGGETTGHDGAGGSTTTSDGGSTSSQGGAGGGTVGGGATGGSGTGAGGTGGSGSGGEGGAGGSGTGGEGGTGNVETSCGNDGDDDGDTLVDCEDPDCAPSPLCGVLLINELDYDDESAPDAGEFVEVLNAGAGPVTLDGLTLELVNGSTSQTYASIPLSGSLPAGGYLVVANQGVAVHAGATVINIADGSIQNGAPDAAALYHAVENVVLDAIAYEGAVSSATINGSVFDLVAGTPTLATDTGAPARSLARLPNAQDTGDDAVDWQNTRKPTPGAANEALEVCDDVLDNDGDGLVDCADPNCDGEPACPLPVEICDVVGDEDDNGAADCDDPVCDMQTCDAFGKVCTGGVCVCAGGSVETVCAGGGDEDCDGAIDCADGDCVSEPACSTAAVTSVDYAVVAHGARLVIGGVGFTAATAVMLGGVPQAFVVDSDTQITLSSVADATPLAAQEIVVATPGGDTPPFGVTVIHLVISEIDYDQSGSDTAEFVEIETGVPNVSLSGYAVVYVNGNNDQVTGNIPLDTVTDENGRTIVGLATTDIDPVSPGIQPPDVVTAIAMQNDNEAVLILQGSSAVGAVVDAATTGVIDVVVYENDAELNSLWTPPAVAFVDLGAQTIQRCNGPQRKDGGAFFLASAPSVDAGNPCN